MNNNINLENYEGLNDKMKELLQTRELSFLEFTRKSMKIIKEITLKYPEDKWLEAIEEIIPKFDIVRQTYLIARLKGKIKNVQNYSKYVDIATNVYNQVDNM